MKGVESTTVLHEIDDVGVLTLTLNRPERSNAWNRELETALHDLLEQAAESDEVRAIVLTGAGRAFCPGLDAEELDRVSQPGESFDRAGRRPVQLPSFVPKPIVAAINGGCAGLGLITALHADIRFAADDAKITTAFARRGLPAEEAVSWILPRIVGHAVALDLLLSGRVVLRLRGRRHRPRPPGAAGGTSCCPPRPSTPATWRSTARRSPWRRPSGRSTSTGSARCSSRGARPAGSSAR